MFIPVKGFSDYLFWDVDPALVDIDKHQSWLVKRVLEKGCWEDWKKLRQLLTKEQLTESVIEVLEVWKKRR